MCNKTKAKYIVVDTSFPISYGSYVGDEFKVLGENPTTFDNLDEAIERAAIFNVNESLTLENGKATIYALTEVVLSDKELETYKKEVKSNECG